MKVALVGNPNAGKTSVFNLLTGLNQKVGNYPGVTVDKKWGYFMVCPYRIYCSQLTKETVNNYCW